MTGPYTVNFGARFGGDVSASSNGTPIANGASVADGSTVVFTATPEAGFSLQDWTVNGAPPDGNNAVVSSDGLTLTITNVDSNLMVTVNFVGLLFTVNITNNPPDGLVTGQTPSGRTFSAGSVVDLVAGTHPALIFEDWTFDVPLLIGDLGADSPNTSFVMPASDVNFTANWGSERFEVAIAGSDQIRIPYLLEGTALAPRHTAVINIRNTGNVATGVLDLTLSGPNASSFVLGSSSMPSIDRGGNRDFTVTPIADLPLGVYEAIVTISNADVSDVNAFIYFEVTDEAFTDISLDPAANHHHVFPRATVGYSVAPSHQVQVENVGYYNTGPVTIDIISGNVDSFVATPNVVGDIPIGATGSFAIAPVLNLPIGQYSATVEVSVSGISSNMPSTRALTTSPSALTGELVGTSLTFDVSFQVVPQSTVTPPPPPVTTPRPPQGPVYVPPPSYSGDYGNGQRSTPWRDTSSGRSRRDRNQVATGQVPPVQGTEPTTTPEPNRTIPVIGNIPVEFDVTGSTLTIVFSRERPEVTISELIDNSANAGNVIIFDLTGQSGVSSVAIPVAAWQQFAEAGVAIGFDLQVGMVRFDASTVLSMAQRATSENIQITLEQVTTSHSIPEGAQVVEISVYFGDEFVGEEIEFAVLIPYGGQMPVMVWLLTEDGQLIAVESTFNEQEGGVAFYASGSGTYVIGPDPSGAAAANGSDTTQAQPEQQVPTQQDTVGQPTVLRLSVDNPIYTVNGVQQVSEVSPFIDQVNSRTMLPLRLASEALGAEVVWIDATRTIIITTATGQFSLPVDSPLPNNMGSVIIRDGRTFVPIAYVAELVGAEVEWVPATREVVITQR